MKGKDKFFLTACILDVLALLVLIFICMTYVFNFNSVANMDNFTYYFLTLSYAGTLNLFILTTFTVLFSLVTLIYGVNWTKFATIYLTLITLIISGDIILMIFFGIILLLQLLSCMNVKKKGAK